MLSFQNWLVIIVVVNFYCIVPSVNTEFCPKVCVPCLENLISCTFGGLTEIPKDLYVDVKKVTLIGHMFSQVALSRQNFSRFSKPKYSIEQLSIRQSNIEIIHSQAFFDLSGLDTLDLSDNIKLVVEERAFANLKLKYLTLDDIGSLSLHTSAFDDLLVASLSLKNSNLKTFPFSLLKPLSKDLRKLFLSKNKIRSLSQNFEALFRQLTVLELYGNPLLCSCDLLWLGNTIRWRYQYFHIQSNSFSTVQNPMCAEPSFLNGESIDKVPESDFDCNPPKLNRIEIRFEKVNTAILKCAASLESKRAPLNISWAYLNGKGYLYPAGKQSLYKHESSISVKQIDQQDRFVCSMVSKSGNSSVKIHIIWLNYTRLVHRNNNISVYRYPNSMRGNTFEYQQSFFFKEQYSLLELLASVICTFILTMLLFIVVYRFYFYKAIKQKKEQLKKIGYATYEVGFGSESQTYDIPQYPSFDKRTNNFQPVFPMPCAKTHIIDYTNHRKI